METEPSEHLWARRTADALTHARLIGSAVVSAEIVAKGKSCRSWLTAAKVMSIFASDFFDGKLARYSNIPSPKSAEKDRNYDKHAYRLLTNALGIASNDYRYAVYSGITDIRNNSIAKDRQQVSLDSTKAGKVKTWAQGLALTVDASPIGERYPRLTHSLHTGAVALAAVTGIESRYRTNRALNELSSQAPETVIED